MAQIAAAVQVKEEPCSIQVPFFRPQIGPEEREELDRVVASGWLTSGPMTRRFEQEFAAAVGARCAVAMNSCTAALHLAVEALGLTAGDAVLVPTMTFAATAEIVRYQGAYPILVDCQEDTCNIDLADAELKIRALRKGKLGAVPRRATLKGIIPVHVGGWMCDLEEITAFASRHGLWIVEDAAHAFPAAWRKNGKSPWLRCGERTANVSCYSFYANKTITTGEGGMAVCESDEIANRMRLMCLHGLSHDAWGRYTGTGTWNYKIIAPGFKYNMADPLAAIGVHQLAKAERFRQQREAIAARFLEELKDLDQIALPVSGTDRVHAWHLFSIRLLPERMTISRDDFIKQLKQSSVGTSVHWRPLHLHPYYVETFGWRAEDCPVASRVWESRVSLPLFPGMTEREIEHVIGTVREVCGKHAK